MPVKSYDIQNDPLMAPSISKLILLHDFKIDFSIRILVFSLHLAHGLPCGLFPSVFVTAFLQHLVVSSVLGSLHFVFNQVQSTFFAERESLTLSQVEFL